jgi:flavin-binding protein dodecin
VSAFRRTVTVRLKPDTTYRDVPSAAILAHGEGVLFETAPPAGDGLSSRVEPRSGARRASKESQMSVAKVSEISSTSKTSFEDAIQQGLARANKTIRNIKSLWIKEQHVRVTDGKTSEYQVNMLVTFTLDD